MRVNTISEVSTSAWETPGETASLVLNRPYTTQG